MNLDQVTEGLRARVGDNSGIDASIKFDFGEDGMIFFDGKSEEGLTLAAASTVYEGSEYQWGIIGFNWT